MGKVKALTTTQIISALAGRAGLTKKAVGDVLDHLCELAREEAANGFKLPGLGKLVLVDRQARAGRNPATGESIEIPARKAVKFRVSKACKDAILGA